LESAEAVCVMGTTASALDLIAGLVEKSMVVADRSEGSGSRYRLLESQIAYAEDRLKDAGESDAMHRRHYEYFTDRLSANIPFSTYGFDVVGDEAEWVARESSNVWSAVMWARNNADDLGLSLAAHLPRVKFGDLAQLRSLLEELLGHSPATGLARVQALNGAAMAAYKQGDYDAAISLADAELTLARDMGDLVGSVQAMNWLASAHEGRGKFDIAAEIFDDAMTLLHGSNNHRLLNIIRNSSADLEVQRGNYVIALQLLAECLNTSRAEGDFGRTGIGLETLGWVQRGMGEHQAAAASWRESLSIARRLTHQLLTVDCLEGLLCAAEAAGDHRRAVCLGAAANRMAQELSYNVDPWWLREYEESLARSRARLGPRASEEAWSEGWSMSVDQAVDYALAGEESETEVEVGRLSRRQKEVAQLVAAGMTNREIADRLFISERTAEGHVDQIRSKLGVRSRTQIASWAVEHGMASGPKLPNGRA
jgi:DNA-binding CsgD family transcriptional regulator/tetratricopeptide (TPR) repeat protein